jgi:hypothetical protein
VYAAADAAGGADAFTPVLGDLLSTCNAQACAITAAAAPAGSATTSGNPFAVDCELAAEEA